MFLFLIFCCLNCYLTKLMTLIASLQTLHLDAHRPFDGFHNDSLKGSEKKEPKQTHLKCDSNATVLPFNCSRSDNTLSIHNNDEEYELL